MDEKLITITAQLKHTIGWMEEVKNDTRNIAVIEEAMLDRDKSLRQKVGNSRLLI